MEGNTTSALVTALQSALSGDTLLAALTPYISVLGGVIVFAFVYRVLRRMVRKTPQGKADM